MTQPEHEAAAPTPLVEVERQIVDLLDGFHDGQRERKAREIVAQMVRPALTAQAQRIAELEFVIADVGGMLDLFDGLGTSNERADLSAFSDRIEAIALHADAAEAERDEARAGLEKAREALKNIRDNSNGWQRDTANDVLASLNTGARSD